MSLKKLLVSGAAALALAGTAFAAAPVTLEQDGTGDYLIAPAAYATGTWQTDLKVVNTNTTCAIVAKVVIREHKNSKEVIDFPIYLSPGDVWTATLKEENGKFIVESTDDSMIIGGKVGSPNDPVVLTRDKTADNSLVYVEVMGLTKYAKGHTWTVGTETVKVEPGMDHLLFYKAINKNPDIDKDNTVNDQPCTSDNWSCDVGDDLMGKQVIFRDVADVNGKRAMMLNMTAMNNFATQEIWKNVYAAETKLENMSDKAGANGSLNTVDNLLKQVDAALLKSHIYVMYEGDGTDIFPTAIHFTDITKKYWYEFANNQGKYLGAGTTNYLREEFKTDSTQSYTKLESSDYYYALDMTKVTGWDNSEHYKNCQPQKTEVSGETPQGCDPYKIPEEIHRFDYIPGVSSDTVFGYAFATGGWFDFDLINIKWGDKNNVQANGMPIIPSTFYAKKLGDIYLNNHLYNQYKKAEIQ